MLKAKNIMVIMKVMVMVIVISVVRKGNFYNLIVIMITKIVMGLLAMIIVIRILKNR